MFSPEEVGLERQIVIGKHSGSAAIRSKFLNEYGLELPEPIIQEVLKRARQMSIDLKRSLFDKELMVIYEKIEGRSKKWVNIAEKFYSIKQIDVKANDIV